MLRFRLKGTPVEVFVVREPVGFETPLSWSFGRSDYKMQSSETGSPWSCGGGMLAAEDSWKPSHHEDANDALKSQTTREALVDHHVTIMKPNTLLCYCVVTRTFVHVCTLS